MKELTQHIEDLVNKNTFSLEGLEAIQRIKEELKQQNAKNETLSKYYTELEDKNKTLNDKIRELQSRCKELEQENKFLINNEKEAELSIHQAKLHKAVADAYRDAMSMVFKPNAVRETVQRQVGVPVQGNPGGNGMMATAGTVFTVPESETVTREDA